MQQFKMDAQVRLARMLGEREATSVMRVLLEDLKVTGKQTDQIQQYEAALQRVLKGEPIQYVVESAHFFGRNYMVNPAVLIPRPETEELVDQVIKYNGKKCRILDVGTGSGCIAITLALELPGVEVIAIDVSEDALEVARTNAKRHAVSIQWLQNDFSNATRWDALGMFDIIVSNPPYVGKDELDRLSQNVVEHEPGIALFPPVDDVLYFYRLLATFASKQLVGQGALFAELNQYHSANIADCMTAFAFQAQIKNDMQGNDRVLIARR